MNKKHKTNWWIDISLILSFLATYFLNLTGLIIHQWVGLICLALAAIHLFLHKDWVKNVVKQLFRKRSGKARLYLVVDLSLLLGLSVIGLTGLVLSTWLNLALPNYDAWRQLHISVSIATLAIVLIKLGLHLRWFERMTRIIFTNSASLPTKYAVSQSTNDNSNRIGRREFLLTMGVLSTASIIALASASKSLLASIPTSEPTEPETDPSQTNESSKATSQTSTTKANVQPSATLEAVTQTPTVEATQTYTLPTTSYETNCTVRCQRGCSYPGHCRRYTDGNNNNLCDLGECL